MNRPAHGGTSDGNRPSASVRPAHPMNIGRIEKAADSRGTLMRLLPYLRPHMAALAMTMAMVVAYTLLGLLGPYLMGRALDEHIVPRRLDGLTTLAILLLGTYVANNALQVTSGWLMAEVSQRALQQLRLDLFAHLQKQPMRFFDRNPAGELMSRLTNDIEAINQAVSQNVTTLLAGALSLVGILVAMFVLDFWLALASLVVVPIMFWFTNFIARYTRKGFRILQKDVGALNAVMEEAISGQRVIQAFRRNDSVLHAFRGGNQKAYEAGVYANTYAFMLMPLTATLGNLFVIVLAAFGGWLALRGLVSVGTIATFISYGQNFIHPLRQLANMYNSIQSALAGAERVFAVLDAPVEVDDAATAADDWTLRGAVRFEDVEFEYDEGTPVLRGMSLDAQPGQMIALVGPTGAGKTTIINLLTRFYEIRSGRITIDGRDVREIPKEALRRQLGMVLQDTFLFSGTVLDNIRFGRLDATDDECIEAARVADADHFIRLLPHGYQTQLSERAGNLSQGQRQLLSIARAVLANPRILILDEATSSVDTRTEARIQQSLLRLMRGRTSFVIAHRLSTIRDADQVLVIDGGRVVERGTHVQLLAVKGVYYKLYISQFKGLAI
jgi:ATP-binding cassette subfamily B multidrug efflux pump